MPTSSSKRRFSGTASCGDSIMSAQPIPTTDHISGLEPHVDTAFNRPSFKIGVPHSRDRRIDRLKQTFDWSGKRSPSPCNRTGPRQDGEVRTDEAPSHAGVHLTCISPDHHRIGNDLSTALENRIRSIPHVVELLDAVYRKSIDAVDGRKRRPPCKRKF